MTALRKHLSMKAIAATIIALLLSVAMASSSEAVSPSQQSNTAYTVLAGFEDVGANGLEVEAFLPEDVVIRVGDTINWQYTPLEPHTVTFLAGTERPVESVELPDGRTAFNGAMILPSGEPGPVRLLLHRRRNQPRALRRLPQLLRSRSRYGSVHRGDLRLRQL